MSQATPRFALGLAAAYLLVAGLGAAHHEPWLDEAQSWLIATRAGSFGEVFRNLTYEGHPPLWHVLLHVAGGLWPKIEAMQALAVLCGAATVFLVGWRSPFSRLQKGLFAFSYFPLFEYGLVARSYAPALTLLAAYAALRHAELRRPLLLALPLALLAQTSIFGLILAWALAVGLAIEALDPPAGEPPPAWPALGGAAALLVASTGLALEFMLVPPNGTFTPNWNFDLVDTRLAWLSTVPIGAWLPFPTPGEPRPWNDVALVHDYGYNRFDLLLGAAILGLAAAALAGRPAALAAFVAGTAVMLAFFHVKHGGALRHHGNVFLLWFACLWIARQPGARLAAWGERLRGPLSAPALRGAVPVVTVFPLIVAAAFGPGLVAGLLLIGVGVALGAIALARTSPAVTRLMAFAAAFRPGGTGLSALLAVQVAAAATLYVADWQRPFGAGAGLARTIQAHPAAAAPVLVLDDAFFAYAAPPVAAHLGRELTFVTERETFPGSFLVWDQHRLFPRDALRGVLTRLPDALPAAGPAWLLASAPLWVAPAGVDAELVAAPAPGVCGDEPARQRLYLATRVPDAGPACLLGEPTVGGRAPWESSAAP